MDNDQTLITYHPIGTIHSPFHDLSNMPIQPFSEFSAPGTVEILPEYSTGLIDLEGFSHVLLIYHFHESHRVSLTVTPFLDSKPHGIFATRAPNRPNPIGISVVKLVKLEGSIIHVENLDILDGTPLLDIKPFIPMFDSPSDIKLGWLEQAKGKVRYMRSDRRFES
jgi:tRNA-Thr(GGU) m(6)t(6)A37 methyltransferase TsaA